MTAIAPRALNRMPRKRSRQHLIEGMSARQLRRAEAAEARRAAKAAAKVKASESRAPVTEGAV